MVEVIDLGSGSDGERNTPKPIPPASLTRLPLYLRVLTNLVAEKVERVSSEELAEAAGVNSPKLRRDLSHLGTYGTRGVGYDTQMLVAQISEALGLSKKWRVIIVGAGNLGRALAGYAGFRSRGFDVVAIFDADQLLIGSEIGYLRVSDIDSLEATIAATRPDIAVLAVPGPAAQEMSERLVAAGITSILSFAPVVLQLPDHVDVRKVDLATELQLLAYHAQKSQEDVPAPKAAGAGGGER